MRALPDTLRHIVVLYESLATVTINVDERSIEDVLEIAGAAISARLG